MRRSRSLVVRRLSLLTGLSLLGSLGCAGDAPPPARPVAAAVAPKPAAPPEPEPFRLKSDAVVARFPADAHLVAVLDPKLLASAEGAPRDEDIVAPLAGMAAAELGIAHKDAERLLRSTKQLALGMKLDRSSGLAMVMRVDDPLVVDPVLASAQLKPLEGEAGGDVRLFTLEASEDSSNPLGRMVVAWSARDRSLAMGSRGIVREIARVLRGEQPSFAEAGPLWDAARDQLVSDVPFVAVFDPAALLEGTGADGVRLASGLFEGHPAGRFVIEPEGRARLEVGLRGLALPSPSLLPTPASIELPKRLPAETIGFFAYARRPELSGAALVAALRSSLVALDSSAGTELARVEKLLGGSLVPLFDVLGQEGAVASLAPLAAIKLSAPGGLHDRRKARPVAGHADRGWLVAHSLRDVAKAKQLVEGVIEQLVAGAPSGTLRVRKRADAITITSQGRKAKTTLVRFVDDHLVVGHGDAAVVERAVAGFADRRRTLSDDPRLDAALDHARGGHGLLRVDLRRLLGASIDDEEKRQAMLALVEPFGMVAPDVVFSLRTDGTAWTATAQLAASSVELAGAVARRAIRSARARRDDVGLEARNQLGAIVRGAALAFERERKKGPAHAFCASAVPVPGEVPKEPYTPRKQKGVDYQAGDEATGWPCLRYVSVQPQRMQLHYNAGGGYLGPKRGGPNPGPNGFEAAAEIDTDGNGKSRLYTRTGRVDPTTNFVLIDEDVFVADESE